MERAGAAVADAAAEMLGGSGRVLVLCGPGNNGGDGFVAARLLAARGHAVTVALLGARERLRGAAAAAAARWPGEVAAAGDAAPGEAGLVIDALFGAGLARDLDGAARRVVQALNASGRPVLAVDVPSGIDGDTGAVRGAAVRAARTVTFAARKPGHLLLPGRAHCGPVAVADIGIAPEILRRVGDRTFANGPALWARRCRRPGLDAHKYQRGHTLVASGGAARTGAARLAARAALRIGSGLVTVASPPEAVGIDAAQLTAVMVRGCDGADGLAAILEDPRFNALVIGPALGVHAMTRTMAMTAVAARRGLVLDADALTSFQGFATELAGAFADAPTVLTPHDGEFARLFAGPPRDPRTRLEARARPPRRRPSRRRPRPQGPRHGDRRARRPGGDQPERHALSGHRRIRRRAGGPRRRPDGPGPPGLRGRLPRGSGSTPRPAPPSGRG